MNMWTRELELFVLALRATIANEQCSPKVGIGRPSLEQQAHELNGELTHPFTVDEVQSCVNCYLTSGGTR